MRLLRQAWVRALETLLVQAVLVQTTLRFFFLRGGLKLWRWHLRGTWRECRGAVEESQAENTNTGRGARGEGNPMALDPRGEREAEGAGCSKAFVPVDWPDAMRWGNPRVFEWLGSPTPEMQVQLVATLPPSELGGSGKLSRRRVGRTRPTRRRGPKHSPTARRVGPG